MGAPGEGAEKAAQSLFAASAVANAIPVAGQFVSAGLAIAGLFTKIFGGRRRKKAAARQEVRDQRTEVAKSNFQAQAPGPASPGGVAMGGPSGSVGTTAPVSVPQTTSFSSWGGSSAPSVQQQVISNAVGFKQ